MVQELPREVRQKSRLADWLALALLILAAGAMAVESNTTSLTFDELLTYFTAALPTPQLIWRSLLVAPLPLDPPLYHWIEHYFIATLGSSEFAIRLSSMAGMLTCLWLVYVFTRRVGGGLAGLLAMSIVIASGALSYGYDARPYGLVLAAAAGALVSWQNLVHAKSRILSAVCFALCLAAADSLHYYSVLICVPFALVELFRIFRWRKVDWLVLSAIAAGNAVMLAFLPLIPATRAYQGTYWRGVSRGDIWSSYRTLFEPLHGAGLLLLLPVVAYVLLRARRRGDATARSGLLPDETVALIAFALYPIIVLALSLTVTHTFSERFALPAILGLSILPALALRAVAKRDAALLLAAGLLLCAVPFHAVRSIRDMRGAQTRYSAHYGNAIPTAAAVFDRVPQSMPIVIGDVVLYLRTMKYAPESIRQRVKLLDLVESSTAAGRKDTGEMAVLGVREGVRMPVITLAEMNSLKEPYFLVCCRPFEKPDDRLRPVLNNDGMRVVPSGAFRYWPVFAMTPLTPSN